jgi:(R,R)-butanediol dehydrogenase/meso-butanediol dehydrogenase/diacetyl reductase
MKVPVFTDLQKIEFVEKPKPEIRPGEVLVKVEYCGICGSDVHGYLNGIMVPPGTVMGHECCGFVSEVGDGVKNFQLGDRVAVKPSPQCGECYWCQRGQYSICPKALERAIGISPNYDGAFAEYIRIQYPNEMLFKLPSEVSFKEAALIEPLATSLHAVRMARFRPGDRVVIIGAGMIGLGTLQFVRLAGAGRIIVLEISSEKSHIARELGAHEVMNPLAERDDLREKILDLTHGIGADVVFECAGVPMAFQTSIEYVKRGGQVMVVGINDKEVAINNFMMVICEVEMKGVLGYYDEFEYVIEFLHQSKIRTEPLISDIIRLTELEEQGFKRLIASQDMVKILVRP